MGSRRRRSMIESGRCSAATCEGYVEANCGSRLLGGCNKNVVKECQLSEAMLTYLSIPDSNTSVSSDTTFPSVFIVFSTTLRTNSFTGTGVHSEGRRSRPGSSRQRRRRLHRFLLCWGKISLRITAASSFLLSPSVTRDHDDVEGNENRCRKS